jgi:hypothetical protein
MPRPTALWLLSAALAACNPRPITVPGDAPTQVTPEFHDQSLNNQADILFVIDKSKSMTPAQESLRQYFPNFMQPLKSLPMPPDLHIGVVTSDLGAGIFTPMSCDRLGGDQGMLQNTPAGATCGAAQLKDPSDRFLVYAPNPGGDSFQNFTGDVADAFACYAAVGDNGCGFEHVLAAAQQALAGCETAAGCRLAANQGFLRPEAYLAVIYLTNEDDCSAPPNSTLFDPSQTELSSALGPATSYRCFEFGNLCGGLDPGRQQGPRPGCEPGSKDANPLHQLLPVEELAAALKALKPQNPRLIYTSVIAAPPAPVAVGVDAQGYPDLQPACTGLGSGADPGLRLSKFVSQFDADRASFISICTSDLQAAMEKIAKKLAEMIGRQCLAAPLVDRDPATPALEPDCVVEDRTTTGSGEVATRVPACQEAVCHPATAPGGDCKCARHVEASPDRPCWFIWPDVAACPVVPDEERPIAEQRALGAGHQIWIDRGTDAACDRPAAPPATRALVQCTSCIANPAENSYDCAPGCAPYWPRCCPTATPGCYP